MSTHLSAHEQIALPQTLDTAIGDALAPILDAYSDACPSCVAEAIAVALASHALLFNALTHAALNALPERRH